LRVNPFQQRNIALCTSNQHALPRLCQAQLMQCADTIRIAIENIIEYCHVARAGAEELKTSR